VRYPPTFSDLVQKCGVVIGQSATGGICVGKAVQADLCIGPEILPTRARMIGREAQGDLRKKKGPVPLSATGEPRSAAKLKIPEIFDGDSMSIRQDAREMRRLKPASACPGGGVHLAPLGD
jgi:hypothetical protein